MDRKREKGKGAERTALNTHSSTRPTGTLFPCKFCLPSPLSLSLSPSPSLVKAERRTCAYPVCTMHTSLPFLRSPAVDLHYPSFRVESITFVYSINLTKTNFIRTSVNDPTRCKLLTSRSRCTCTIFPNKLSLYLCPAAPSIFVRTR